MNTTMKNQNEQRLTDAIKIAFGEVRRDAIEECASVIWKQYEQYQKLINSTEAESIWHNSNGDKFIAINEKQRSLIRKMGILSKILGKLYDLKWPEQKEKEK